MLNLNSNRLPPRVPTAAEDPAVGHADYPVEANATDVPWIKMYRTVLCFPCATSRMMKPWYMFRVHANGTVRATCDFHNNKDDDRYCPWPFQKYITKAEEHANQPMTGWCLLPMPTVTRAEFKLDFE